MSKHVVTAESGAMAVEGRKTRSAALRALVGASALAIPSIGSTPYALGDPILTAIECHKAARDALDATRFAIDNVMYHLEREVSEAEWDAHDRAQKNEDDAFDELFTTGAPKTSAGMRAVIAHLIFLDDGRLSTKMRQLLTALLASPLFDYHSTAPDQMLSANTRPAYSRFL